MNRRSLLSLLGGAVAMPSVGVKSAATALGIEPAALTLSEVLEGAKTGPAVNGWWGSPMQIAFDAKERTRYEAQHGVAYPHMKSWGHGFRIMQAERDNLILQVYRQKMEADTAFRDKVLAALTGAR